MFRTAGLTCVLVGMMSACPAYYQEDADVAADLQRSGIADGQTQLGYWGTDSTKYSTWKTHSNRLIPVYGFGTKGGGMGVDFSHYTGVNSRYRSEDALRSLYGRIPERTVDQHATWMDQTDVAQIQRAAAQAGRKYIFLVVFDGMDWDTTRAAAIWNEQAVSYSSGRGQGTHFQTYDASGTSQFATMVTSPHNEGTNVDVNSQTVKNPGGKIPGGYDASLGGSAPWESPAAANYLIAKPDDDQPRHAYTDSAASATSMMAGVKTYNGAINIGPSGEQLSTVAHELQEAGYAVGAVSSVPFPHATPACAYAHNVTRKDYQDISRDMLGLKSVAHPNQPLPGLDVVIGCGLGKEEESDSQQGDNYEAGNSYFADSDLQMIDVARGGRYLVVQSTAGTDGGTHLQAAAQQAASGGHRLFGFFGVGRYNGHLPYQTANGDYRPVPGIGNKAEQYSDDEVRQNPTLADMTKAAITVLSKREQGFWLLVEAGDVDWANHDNNIDNAIGAVNSGDAAVRAITDWVEQNSSWDESLMIVTADHGHMFFLEDPQLLIRKSNSP